jgi:hypothetical protein
MSHPHRDAGDVKRAFYAFARRHYPDVVRALLDATIWAGRRADRAYLPRRFRPVSGPVLFWASTGLGQVESRLRREWAVTALAVRLAEPYAVPPQDSDQG